VTIFAAASIVDGLPFVHVEVVPAPTVIVYVIPVAPKKELSLYPPAPPPPPLQKIPAPPPATTR
jgi:hypothetical protein